MSDHSTLVELDDRGLGAGVALRFGLVAVVLLGLAFPSALALLGQTLFPFQARGSLLVRNGVVVESALVAQPFSSAGYFQPRPSAAGYDPKVLAGSNLAPSNPALRERLSATSAEVATRENVPAGSLPADLITASGSGIDPHISPDAAEIQVARVATARDLPPAAVRQLVAAHTQARTFGLLGQARVDVLQLNLALDAATP